MTVNLDRNRDSSRECMLCGDLVQHLPTHLTDECEQRLDRDVPQEETALDPQDGTPEDEEITSLTPDTTVVVCQTATTRIAHQPAPDRPQRPACPTTSHNKRGWRRVAWGTIAPTYRRCRRCFDDE